MRNIFGSQRASWYSNFNSSSAHYNNKTWELIANGEDEFELMLGFFDKKDGASVMVTIEVLEDIKSTDSQMIEDILFSGLVKKDSALLQVRTYEDTFINERFHFIEYAFNNEKFGKQKVFHIYKLWKDHIVIFLCAFSLSEVSKETVIPQKHLQLCQDIYLDEPYYGSLEIEK